MHKIRSYTPSFEASSGLYFVQDENNFINPLFQVGSGSGSGEPNINGSDWIRILIPSPDPVSNRYKLLYKRYS